MTMMQFTRENYSDAYEVIRHILYMYVDMITTYHGFGHNIETGEFDPFRYVDAEIMSTPGWNLGIDLELIHYGSGIAILCELSNAWDEYGTGDVPIWPRTQEAQASLSDGRFSHLPDVERAIALAFGENEGPFREQLKTIYMDRVVGYFQGLIAGQRREPHA
jgi:hypothetical protein